MIFLKFLKVAPIRGLNPRITKVKSQHYSKAVVLSKKGVLRNLAKFTRKHLYQSLLLNKVAGLGPAILLKNRLWCSCFPANFAKFSRTPSFTEYVYVGWLLWLFTKKTYLMALKTNSNQSVKKPFYFYFHSYELRKQNYSSWNANYQLQAICKRSGIYIMKILIRSTLLISVLFQPMAIFVIFHFPFMDFFVFNFPRIDIIRYCLLINKQ